MLTPITYEMNGYYQMKYKINYLFDFNYIENNIKIIKK